MTGRLAAASHSKVTWLSAAFVCPRSAGDAATARSLRARVSSCLGFTHHRRRPSELHGEKALSCSFLSARDCQVTRSVARSEVRVGTTNPPGGRVSRGTATGIRRAALGAVYSAIPQSAYVRAPVTTAQDRWSPVTTASRMSVIPCASLMPDTPCRSTFPWSWGCRGRRSLSCADGGSCHGISSEPAAGPAAKAAGCPKARPPLPIRRKRYSVARLAPARTSIS